ncbi:MAG: M14 family metallopeptidase [Burkholderiales bacterium]
MIPTISSAFDSGAIEVVSDGNIAPTGDIALRIRTDSHADFRQWFHFRLSGARELPCSLRFENASACTYPEGWKDYRVVASYDRAHWFRVPTRYDGTVMTVEHTPDRNAVWYAYFEPYSLERHQALIGRASDSPLVRTERLGGSVEGRDMDLITVGRTNGARKAVWIIARQHPGESMAEWFMEGMIDRLIDRTDPISRRLLERAVLYLVPNMNPDGSGRGNLRTNAAGANLNREWMAPSMDKSPEVFLVRERLQQTGVDAFVDVHGDEGLPYVFIAGGEMLPGFGSEQALAQREFITDFKRASPDFQDVHGYSAGKYNEDALKLASKWAGHTFGCLSVTLEMPFKDNANLPDPELGWNGERSRKLGAAVLEPLLASIDRIQ